MLEKIEEGANIKHSTIDEEGEAIATPEDFGSIINITERVIVNDELGVLQNITPQLTTGANERQRRVLLAPIEANGGDGQTMRDGNPAFHATRGNVAAAGSALSVASLGAARKAMRAQKDTQGAFLGAVPWALLVPSALETEAEQLLETINATKASDVNPFGGKLELLVEPGLASDTGWYVLADPSKTDGHVHTFLDGRSKPRVETRPGWKTLSTEMRIVWHLGASFIQPRAWFHNPGA